MTPTDFLGVILDIIEYALVGFIGIVAVHEVGEMISGIVNRLRNHAQTKTP